MTKDQDDRKWLRTKLILTEQQNKAMYLCMEGRSYAAAGKIMGVSRSRILQLISKYQRQCKQEAKMHLPRRNEVDELLPQIDLIKSIYKN